MLSVFPVRHMVSLCIDGLPVGAGFPVSIWLWSRRTACRTVSDMFLLSHWRCAFKVWTSFYYLNFVTSLEKSWFSPSHNPTWGMVIYSIKYTLLTQQGLLRLSDGSAELQCSDFCLSIFFLFQFSWLLPVFIHRLAPVFSLFVPFYLSIPRMPVTQVLGHINITNKSLVYIVGLQVSPCSHIMPMPLFCFVSCCSWIHGCFSAFPTFIILYFFPIFKLSCDTASDLQPFHVAPCAQWTGEFPKSEIANHVLCVSIKKKGGINVFGCLSWVL